MKKSFIKIISGFILFLVLITIYFNSTYYIKNQEWKYSSGEYIGDYFDKNNVIIESRIIYSQKGKAKIIFCLINRLIIENIETKEKGIYINKA